MQGWVDLMAWLHTEAVADTHQKTVTHPSTNRAQREVTSFMRRRFCGWSHHMYGVSDSSEGAAPWAEIWYLTILLGRRMIFWEKAGIARSICGSMHVPGVWQVTPAWSHLQSYFSEFRNKHRTTETSCYLFMQILPCSVFTIHITDRQTDEHRVRRVLWISRGLWLGL